ncbi:DNA-binding protein [Halosimplex pelagicum]|nr:DNA-binding protein [Halosimplex pelagicum]
MTLEAEERFHAREDEIRRTRQRWDRRGSSDREERTREVVSGRTRYATEEPPEDPREQLSREQLADVNRHAGRIVEALEGRSRAATAWRLAKEVLSGVDMLEAVLAVREELQATPGIVVPIAAVGEVPRSAVDIEGEVVQLWEPSNTKIQSVGLIEDESGRTKFTIWKRSGQPWVSEGECVRLRNVEKSWYQGRVSVAVTGWSEIEFPEKDRWWTE